jgi:hypothetical protein
MIKPKRNEMKYVQAEAEVFSPPINARYRYSVTGVM